MLINKTDSKAVVSRIIYHISYQRMSSFNTLPFIYAKHRPRLLGGDVACRVSIWLFDDVRKNILRRRVKDDQTTFLKNGISILIWKFIKIIKKDIVV